MLPGDAEIAARDPEVGALPIVLDDDRLTDLVRARWAAAAPPPDRLRVTYLRYKPRTMVVAAVESMTDGTRGVHLLVATSDAARAKLDKLRVYAARHELPVFVADEAGRLLVTAVEGDRHLPGLRGLAGRVGRLDAELLGGELTVLAYKPHRRLVARVDVEGEPAALLKVHQPETASQAVDALRWVRDAALPRLPLPRLRARDADRGVALTSWAAGEALHEQTPARQRATLRAVGKTLGRLHQLDPRGLPARAEPRSASLLDAIGRIRPDLGTSARWALELAACDRSPNSPVHGDLSPDQVVHGPRGVALIDLDRAGRGCPAADLASWVAATIVERPDDPHAARLPTSLLEGYRSVGGPAAPGHVARHLPIELLRRATDPFRLRRSDWSTTMDTIVARAGRSAVEAGAA